MRVDTRALLSSKSLDREGRFAEQEQRAAKKAMMDNVLTRPALQKQS
jgi:hypothetical protein